MPRVSDAEADARTRCLRARGGGTPGSDEGSRRRGARPAPPDAGRAQARPDPRGEAAGDQRAAPAGHLPERAADLHPPRGPRAHRRPAGGGRQADPAARRLRHLPGPQRRRHRRRVLGRPQDAGGAAPRAGQRGRGRSSAGAHEVVLNESLNVVLARSAEQSGEVVTLKEHARRRSRAIIVGRADEERVVELADSLAGRQASGRATRC